MNRELRSGYIAGFSAYLLWGVLPVYWKLLGIVPPAELLAWRVAGCGATAWIFVALRRRTAPRSVFSTRVLAQLGLAALLIGGNWGIYIWAVSAERILEASLGYYINPLVNVVLGVVFFSETLGRRRLIAVALALTGVVLMTLETGTVPWVSLLLALLFGFYGMTVKRLPPEIDSVEVLAWQGLLLAPLSGGYLALQAARGEAHIAGFGAPVTVLLLAAGLITLVPLWLFGAGAKRIPLSSLGFLQYIAPTLMLLLGTLVYGEPFGLFRAAAFALVAAALVLYSTTFGDS